MGILHKPFVVPILTEASEKPLALAMGRKGGGFQA
jgi:hypothetical protein